MKKKTLFVMLVILIAIVTSLLSSCTDQSRAKHWGGSTSINLPKGEKLVVVTWKESGLWYLTRKMNSTDTALTYSFREESSWDIMEGEVTIVESK